MTTDTHAMPVPHEPPAEMAHGGQGGISNPVLGMLLFITSEVMFFGGLFAAYFSLRANSDAWPPINELTGHPFELSIFPFVGPATVLLILSSVTCQLAVWAIQRDDRTAFVRAMAVTVLLGVVFLGMQVIDYSLLGSEGLTLLSGQYGTTYYTLTGFHGAHVFGGVIMLSVVLYRGMAGQFSSKHHDAVEAASLYWHFVDVVWILLFSLLYFLPGTTAAAGA
ncbi:MAG: heme-copper oxidase subunit III [Chloroflexi bacterium]|nr:heme-copper oxidase subunit III [Chloroflexota bacterium]